jgi:hypothetical protein
MIEAENAIIIRSDVIPKKDYHAYRDFLRLDFYYACAYCSITEIEATGISFQIDHYYPIEVFPQLASNYDNLMWSCQICNRYKSNYYPDEEDLRIGYVIIRIDKCDPRGHLEADADGVMIKAKTKTGEFNIQWLDLNRRQLRRLREYRRRLSDARNYIIFGVHELVSLELDKVAPTYRLLFQKIKRHIEDREKQVTGPIKSLIRNFAHSELLDSDPDKKERQKKRRQYLKEQKAIVHED